MPEERHRVADLLESLRPDEWDLPTPCEGWRVRDVAGHLTMAPNVGVVGTVLGVLRARGDVNRFIHDDGVARGARPPTEVVADLRAAATSRRHPPPTKPLDPLVDVVIHGWDIATAVGRPWEIRTDVAVAGADRIWGAGRFPFDARGRLAGHRLVATDADWSAGEGTPVEAPIGRLLLLVSGRLDPQEA